MYILCPYSDEDSFFVHVLFFYFAELFFSSLTAICLKNYLKKNKTKKKPRETDWILIIKWQLKCLCSLLELLIGSNFKCAPNKETQRQSCSRETMLQFVSDAEHGVTTICTTENLEGTKAMDCG